MSKNKDKCNAEEKKETSTSSSLPEDKPGEVNPSPAIEEVASKGPTLHRGIEMEAVDSPRYGRPGQTTGTRGYTGGGEIHPSAQVGRSPDNPQVRGAGSDPLMKIDIRDELSWNEMGANQFRTAIDGSAAGFAPDAILGNFTYVDNLAFQFDNFGDRPGQLGVPYRRRVESISKDQCIFVRGQHDDAVASALKFYPTYTYAANQARSQVSVSSLTGGVVAERSNYLMRGMQVNITKTEAGTYAISSISFDTDELPSSSSSNDLDVRQDNARVIWDDCDKAITETLFDLVNKPENLQANKYSPIPDGQPDALQHLLLSQDVACTDGVIAFAAVRSAMETYAYHRMMRREYGSGSGARAQARSMIGERAWRISEPTEVWADNTLLNDAAAVGSHDRNWIRLSPAEYIQTYLDSPTKYNDGFGVWLVQPRGVRMLFEEAQKGFDKCGFMIDTDTFTIMDKVMGWHKMDGRIAGVGNIGIITPVDYNQIYALTDIGSGGSHSYAIVPDESGDVHGKYIFCDYVLNGSMFNHTEIRSPLVDAILQVIKYRVIPKLEGGNVYNIYIPFDFACDHYSFGQFILMEAVAYMHQFIHNARAIFERFEDQYGVNPIKSPLMSDLTLADVMKGSSYKGIGADPVPKDADECLRLVMMLPETYELAAQYTDGTLEFADALVGIKFSDLAPISDSINEPQKLLFPMLYKTERMAQWDRLLHIGPEKLLCSRDFPIHRYSLTEYADISDSKKFKRVGSAVTYYNTATPFFERQEPQVYYTGKFDDNKLGLKISDVLCAPRFSGRIAPAPMGLLDFVRLTSENKDADDMTRGKFFDLNLKQGASDTVSTYGWMSSLDDFIIEISESSSKLKITGYDIDNYRVQFVFMPEYQQNLLGMLLNRYFVHFSSGQISSDALATLQQTYGVYVCPAQSQVSQPYAQIIPPQATVTVAAEDSEKVSKKYDLIKVGDTVYSLDSSATDYVGNTYTDITVSTALLWRTIANASESDAFSGELLESAAVRPTLWYVTDNAKMWTDDNVLQFISSPFTGNIAVELAKNDPPFGEINNDLTNALMYGLAGYQGLWYDRFNVDIYAIKQAAGGRIYDNEILHKSNLFFE